jgi:hypothetical protein
LVITCEGNAGFYEMGMLNVPLDAGYSVVGWNHPGFWGSTGSPLPEQGGRRIDSHKGVLFAFGLTAKQSPKALELQFPHPLTHCHTETQKKPKILKKKKKKKGQNRLRDEG